MNKLLERSFADERYKGENVPDGDGSIEERGSPLLRHPERVRKTGSAALNEILQLRGILESRDFQSELPTPTEDALHDSH